MYINLATWAMTSFCLTYSNDSNLLKKMEVSLLTTSTSLLRKYSYNQIANRCCVAHMHLLVLPLGTLRAE